MTRLIIWGAGELGSRVAQRWQDGPVIGLTETTRRHEELRALGVEARLGSAVPLLRPGDVLLVSLPGSARADAVTTLADVPPPGRAVLISSTGYYGLAQGTVDETTPAGDSARAQKLAAAEQAFRAWAGAAGVVLRMGGLYRPGRGPMAALARRGTASVKPPNKTLALIHYEDAATATAAALQRDAVAPVYLTVTPPCPSRRQFYEAACARLGLDPPQFAAPLPGPPAGYDVTRLRRHLMPTPAYPDWRAALILP